MNKAARHALADTGAELRFVAIEESAKCLPYLMGLDDAKAFPPRIEAIGCDVRMHIDWQIVSFGKYRGQKWSANNAGAGSMLRFNPVGGVDDPRLTQILGQF